MKRRVYFVGSAIIQILASIYAIINANELAKQLLEVSSFLDETTNQQFNSMFKNGGSTYIIFLSVICILLNCLIIWWSKKNILLRKKGGVIACSVISIFTASYMIVTIMAVINILVMVCSKRVGPEDYPLPKEKLPNIKKEQITMNKIVAAIILVSIYFSQFIWSEYLEKLGSVRIFVGLGFYILLICLSIYTFSDLFKDNFQIFRKNIKAYFQNLLPLIGKYYIVYFVVALTAIILTHELVSVNQQSIEELPLWYSFPLAVIYAPIVEETIFRGCIRRFIKSDKIFIIASALIFGLLHTILSEETLYNTFVMALPYMTMGGFLAYIYTKTNNMFCNMSFHAFHNFLGMVILIILK